MNWKDIQLGLFSAGAGVGLFWGSGLLLMGKGMIGLLAFLLGIWNLYLMLIHLNMEGLKAREFALHLTEKGSFFIMPQRMD